MNRATKMALNSSFMSSIGVSGYYIERLALLFMAVVSAIDSAITKLLNPRKYNELRKTTSVFENGFITFRLKIPPEIKYEVAETIPSHQYLAKRILTEKSVNSIASFIMNDPEIRSALYGFSQSRYSLDYLYYSHTLPIPESEQNKRWYANQWHSDLPLSDSTLKIFILVKDISTLNGPFTFIDKPATKNAYKMGFNRSSAYESTEIMSFLSSNSREFTGTQGDLCVVSPRCIHKAGIPAIGHERELIMLQLNPSKNWSYCSDLFQRQHLFEPKFPFFKQFKAKVNLPD